MRWFVYLVRCRDGSLYTGITTDPAARLRAHNTGRGARYTRGRTPVALVHVEPVRGRVQALRLEWAIKHWTRGEKLRPIGGPEGALSPTPGAGPPRRAR